MLKGPFKVTISLCGDLFISRRIPATATGDKLPDIQKILKSHECVFGNLEVPVLRKNEGYPELFPGGSYGMASPGCLRDLKDLGFNLFNAATNHAMDYGHNGLIKTLENLEDVDIPVAGIGRNLAEASAPAFCECQYGRVSLLSVTTSFHDSYAAGPANQDMIGRPGVSPLRHKAIYELNSDDYNQLVRIARETGINTYQDAGVKLGYVVKSDYFKFGTFEFKEGNNNSCHTYPLQSDLERTIHNIKDAKIQSDIVIVSIHSHQPNPQNKNRNAEFVETFAKECIDAGADIIACHGPHRLKGIEIYKNGIIFHGLGNMIFQIDQQSVVPEEFYQKYGTTRQECDGVGTINLLRSNNNTRGFITMDQQWKSVIVSMSYSNESIDIELFPIEISKITGLPSVSKDETILKDLQEMSKEFGIVINVSNNIGNISLNRTKRNTN